MDADYSIELGADAPALELPWLDPEGLLEYIDLRREPAGIERIVERIPEAREFPALRALLIEVNSQQCAWQTAKCDVWAEAVDAAENLYGAKFAQNCYLDLVLTAQWTSLRESLELHEKLARQLARSLESDESLEATAEIVVRRCYFHREAGAKEFSGTERPMDTSDAGYCLTLYVSGFGSSVEAAAASWERAMGLAAGCLLHLQPQEERAKG
jgi:hypothetical protein